MKTSLMLALVVTRFGNKLTRILWGAALLTLPVTSFRWFPFLGEGTLVRPLALYPLALLLPLLLIQWMARKNKTQLGGRVDSAWGVGAVHFRSDQFRGR